MCKIITLFLCIPFLGFAKSKMEEINEKQGKTYALVIGISSYQNTSVPQLQFADKDASLFADYIASNIADSLRSERIKLLVNQDASIAAVYNALDWLKNVCSENDTAYIYFSGHGDIETKAKKSQGFLLAYNSPPNNYQNNAISIDDLNEIANILTLEKHSYVVLITDACHSGKLAGDFYKGKQWANEQLQKVLNDQVRLASCKPDQLANEGNYWGGGRGIFSYYLLKGLNGFADSDQNGNIQLKELQAYLQTSFEQDVFLKDQKKQQEPVLDGNPIFTLGIEKDKKYKNFISNYGRQHVSSTLPPGLSLFKPLATQNIDLVFRYLDTLSFENKINFSALMDLKKTEMVLGILDDLIYFQDTLCLNEYPYCCEIYDEINDTWQKFELANIVPDSLENLEIDFQEHWKLYLLKLFKSQVEQNPTLTQKFIDKFVLLIHNRGQDMINAYLAGDLAELEKRQYYYSGERNYTNFLNALEFANHILPENNYLKNILSVNQAYLAGVIARIGLANQPNTDSLLRASFAFQRKAFDLEPYAAYIQNELGNLYLNLNQKDSAEYHYNYAALLAPSWAIPWNNKVKLYLQNNKLKKAKQAFATADSLQPDLPYLLINAGLLKEKENNLLEAEYYYLQATSLNKVHYLPYEKLANIYLETGEFEKANYFFSMATERKINFQLNEDYFKFGLELGGLNISDFIPEFDTECIYQNTTKDSTIDIHLQLARAIYELKNRDDLLVKDILNYGQILDKKNNLPLLSHYIGLKLYELGQADNSIVFIQEAIKNYMEDDELLYRLNLLNTYNSNISCLINFLLLNQYDKADNYYLMADYYLKKGQINLAIEAYQKIIAIENKSQTDQAKYKNLDLFSGLNVEANYSFILNKFELPIQMGGSLKLARLYEEMETFDKAERVLLEQVAQNRKAGYLHGNKGAFFGSPSNYYWLNINRDFEAETYSFYQRMIARFPRNFYWYQNAGIFLHDRLELTYQQLPAGSYQDFTDQFLNFQYPWISGEGSMSEWTEDYIIPVSREIITIHKKVYHPVYEAITNLENAIRLSGELIPDSKISKNLGDLYHWSGNFKKAAEQYQNSISKDRSPKVVNKLIEIYKIDSQLLKLKALLENLRTEGSINLDQNILLSRIEILSKKKISFKALEKELPTDDLEKKQEIEKLKIMDKLISNKPNAAIEILLKPLLEQKTDKPEPERLYYENYDSFSNETYKYYALARLFALSNKEVKALDYLNKAINSGFNYGYLLDNDPAWQKWIFKPFWQDTISRIPEYEYHDIQNQNWANPTSFTIPK